MDIISKHFSYVNLIKQEYIDYLQLTMPLFSNLDNKHQQKIFDLINTLFFGEETKAESLSEKKVTLRNLEKAIKQIKTISAEELRGKSAELALNQNKNIGQF